MGKQIFNIKGMTRDLDPAKSSNQYAYEIRNLRLTAQEDTTLLALITEKGNTEYTITGDAIIGNIVGYCTIDKYLTLFTYDNDTNYIYRLTEQDNIVLNSLKLYEGNLGFDTEDTLETIGVFENENIIKVYWIDGKHQPRFINIVADAETIQGWETKDTPFDFVPAMSLKETVEIGRAEYSGMFPAGTIQYALSYFNKNGQQSNIFYISPIYYTSPDNRGGSPEETVSNSFRITINNTDSNFNSIRIYSIQRTSENGTPICKIVKDVENIGTLVSDTQHTFTPTTDTGRMNNSPRIKIWNHSENLFLESNKVPLDTFLTEVSGNTRVYTVRNFVNSTPFISGYDVYLYTGMMTSGGELVKKYTSKPPTSGSASIERSITITETLTFDDAPNDISYTISSPDVSPLSPDSSIDDFIEETDLVDTEIQNMDVSYNTISIIDNGMIGQIVDISEILFAGGSAIIPHTMEQKNNTLFFGNYAYTDDSLSESDINAISEGIKVYYGYADTIINKGTLGNHYMYKNQLELSNKEITTFKGGEYYIFGVILQTNTGTWTSVIPIGTFLNSLYPKDSETGFRPVKAFLQISPNILTILSRYKTIKAVYSSYNNILCQGALCPTLFSKRRNSQDSKVYAQSSWYFRTVNGVAGSTTPYLPYNIHNHSLGADADNEYHTQEIMGAATNGFYKENLIDTYSNTDMFVDWNTLTINSPDIEWGSLKKTKAKMRLVGAMPITAGVTSMNLNLSSSLKNPTRDGLSFNPIVNNNISILGYQINLNEYIFNDDLFDALNDESLSDLEDSWGDYSAYYPIFTWQREGSITTQNDNTTPYSELKTKVIASLRESAYTDYFINNLEDLNRAGLEYDISPFDVYYDDNRNILIERQNENSLYLGAINNVLSSDIDLYAKYNNTIRKRSIAENAYIRMKYNSGIHGVFSLSNKDNTTTVLPNVYTDSDSTEISDAAGINPILIVNYSMDLINITHPSVSSELESDEIAIYYDPSTTPLEIGDIFKNEVSESSKYYLYSVTSKIIASGSHIAILKKVNGKFLTNHAKNNHIKIIVTNEQASEETASETLAVYKSYVRWVEDDIEYYYPIFYKELRYSYRYESGHYTVRTYTYDGEYNNSEDSILEYDTTQVDVIIQRSSPFGELTPVSNYIYLAEIYLDNPYIERDYKNVVWKVAGLPKPINSNLRLVEASYGDTYYQRYDCLKTYPYSLEDTNQVIEIFSFMCETKVNIDGRYDLRRGLTDNTVVHNTNFNLLNRAYTQADNIYSYSYIDPKSVVNNFPNQILWTLPKTYGSDIDQWTHIVPTSILDMDGVYGKITSLNLWNENLICFQDMGIAKISYNDRTALSTTSGVPIEVANSGKVEGKHYISNQVGCRNKQSIKVTQGGLYFIDSNKKELYELSEGLSSLSKSKGFNSYFHTLPDQTLDSIKTFYDPKLRDLYFKIDDECLVYSEQFGEFLSFLDYNADFIFPFGKSLIATKDNTLWKQFDGNYLSYFGENVGYNIEFISSEYPTVDKTFYNLEFRADVLNGNITEPNVQDVTNNENKTPFSFVRVWNEYQDTGIVDFTRTIRRNGFSNINQRFRIWHSDIPRDSNDTRGLDRIRSPWVRINLGNTAESKKTIIHDIGVNYL